MHNIDMTGGRANIAFRGSRNDIWHRLGQEMQAGMSIDQWATNAGLNWEAVKVPAIAFLNSEHFNHLTERERLREVKDRFHVVRSDTGLPLGYCSDIYQPVQPRELLDWFDRYISVDDRFELDVAGSLKAGETIWATATFREPLDIAGDAHTARVLMSTTFDGSGSTINQGSMTRVVCNNTLNVALADKRAVIRTRHSTTFDAAKVGRELAAIAKGFANYKAIGEALATAEMAKDETFFFFRKVLDIPKDAKPDDMSSRKANQLSTVERCYRASVAEGCPPGSAWAALNAITRYVDHDRTKTGGDEAVLATAQFGSGAQLKAQAFDLLMPLIKDRELVLV